MDRFQEMRVLLAVTEAQSLAGGAKRLGMSPPGVTRAIASLEKRLGILLLARSTRSLRLTEAGQRYVEDCRRILLELQEAEELASGSNVRARGNLNVTASVMFGEQFLIPLITDYLGENAEVTVNAIFVDRLVNMVEEDIDVAIRIGQLPDGAFHALKVGEIRPVICAAPQFLDRVGRPETPQDLDVARIVMSSASTLLTNWEFNGPAASHTLRPQPRLVVSSNQAAINAARMGWGFTRVLSYQVADSVNKGELETVLDGFGTQRLPVHILYQSGKPVSGKVRTFVDYCYSQLLNNPALREATTE